MTTFLSPTGGPIPRRVTIDVPEPVAATFDSAASRGKVVYVSADNHVDLAKANAFATSIPVGMALANVGNNEAGTYATGGPITLEDWTHVIGTEFLQPGKIYFLSVSEAGCMTIETSQVSGTYVVIMGTALSQTTFRLDIHRALVNG